MWIITDFGFFSCVAHRTKPDHILVRSRACGDLETFIEKSGLKIVPTYTPAADYPYRVEVPRYIVANLVARSILTMRYDNFKTQIGRTQGIVREAIYHDVWSTLRYIHNNNSSEA